MENSSRKTGSKRVAVPKSKTKTKTRVTTTEVRARAIRTRARASSRTDPKASRTAVKRSCRQRGCRRAAATRCSSANIPGPDSGQKPPPVSQENFEPKVSKFEHSQSGKHFGLSSQNFSQKSSSDKVYLSQNETHSGDTPFQCERCGRCFGQGDHLRRHLRTHSRSMLWLPV